MFTFTRRRAVMVTVCGVISLGMSLPGNALAAATADKGQSDANKGQTATPPDCPNTFHHANTGHGANVDGAYNSTCDGSASHNGNSDKDKAAGKPCAGCVGNADMKNPPGQAPNGSDHNRGYECDANNGIGKGNPAHTDCTTVTTVPAPATTVPAPATTVPAPTTTVPVTPATTVVAPTTAPAPTTTVPAPTPTTTVVAPVTTESPVTTPSTMPETPEIAEAPEVLGQVITAPEAAPAGLAITGSSIGTPLLAGIVLFLAGLASVAVSKLRRRSLTADKL